MKRTQAIERAASLIWGDPTMVRASAERLYEAGLLPVDPSDPIIPAAQDFEAHLSEQRRRAIITRVRDLAEGFLLLVVILFFGAIAMLTAPFTRRRQRWTER